MVGKQVSGIKVLDKPEPRPCAVTEELEAVKAENLKLKAELSQSLEQQEQAVTETQSFLEELRKANNLLLVEQEKYGKLVKEYKRSIEARLRADDHFQSALRELKFYREENARQDEFMQQLLRQVRRLQDERNRALRAKENMHNKLKVRNNSSGNLQALASAAEQTIPAGKGLGKDRRRRTSSTNLQAKAAEAESSILAGFKPSEEMVAGSTGTLQNSSEGDGLQHQLRLVTEEKQRIEEAQELLTWQTEKLLKEKNRLLHDISQKEKDVQHLETTVMNLENELDIAIGERETLVARIKQIVPQEFSSKVLAPTLSPAASFEFVTPERTEHGLDASAVPCFAETQH